MSFSLVKSWQEIRDDFPMIANVDWTYLDSGATSQKPRAVIERVNEFTQNENATVHRGVYRASYLATDAYDRARAAMAAFLNANANEVVLTHGCTSGLNLVAQILARGHRIQAGDRILVSTLEHHSNFVPWMMVAEQIGATVEPIPISDEGELDLDAFERLLTAGGVRVVAVTHVSNVLGTVNPIAKLSEVAHRNGALVVVDGAQAGPHQPIDVRELDVDFYSVSCHKMYAPTGIGALFGRRALLQALPPYEGGGGMIRTVGFDAVTYADAPEKYEAGTPNVSGAIGLGAAIEYFAGLSGSNGTLRDRLASTMTAVARREAILRRTIVDRLSELPGVRVLGPDDAAGVVSFVVSGVHPHDVGTVLDTEGVAVRVGHHCCMPLMNRLGIPATTRASLGLYSNESDVEALVRGVQKTVKVFA